MTNHYNKNKYFAAEDDPKKTASYLHHKAQSWFDNLYNNRYLAKLKKSWMSYHGVYYEDGHQISFGGETGELVNLAINHYRNIANHILTMITASRPSFQARSVNTDYKSQVQTKLASGLLEYYMREHRLEKYLKTAVEYAVVLGSGYIKMEWNATSGEIYDYIDPQEEEIASFDDEGNPLDEEGNILESYPVYQGDVQFSNLSPLDVVFDTTKETSMDHDWVVCRSFKNKFDLIKKYPEYEQEILALRTKSENHRYRISISPLDETVDIAVYEFFHRKTEALPSGKYMLYLSPDIILMDTPMPYRKLPIYRISPSDILGSPFGYTPMFDLIPIQDAFNSLNSTIMTNQTMFGVQSILSPRGNDISFEQVQEGLNFIEYNPNVGGADGTPRPLQLTQTPQEIFNYMQMLERHMETVSGINSVTRGNPENSLRSGTALALVQSQSLQFISGLQQSYIMLIEDIGTGLIQVLQDFAKVPRVAEISGISNKSKMKEFTSEDIDTISRVIVDVGNSLAATTAGKVQMADNMLQMGLIKSPEQYFSVLNTGRLDVMTDSQTTEAMLVKAENEKLVDGTVDPIAIATDDHAFHIREHKYVLSDPELRRDPQLVAKTLNHIQEHLNLLRTTDPDLLAINQEQPLGPAGGSPVTPGNAAPAQPNKQGSNLDQIMANPNAQNVANIPGASGLPSMPEPPVDPQTGLPLQAQNRPLGV